METRQLLDELHQWKSRFGPGQGAKIESLLRQLQRRRIDDASSLIRLHEMTLFVRAYPPSRDALDLADSILDSFEPRVAALGSQCGELLPFEEAEISGIAGTGLTAVFSHGVARHLARRGSVKVDIDWDRHDEVDRLLLTLPRLIPLLDDDAQVEAHVPWRQWVDAAARGKNHLKWLLDGIDRIESDPRARAERYEALRIPLRLDFTGSPASRTMLRYRPKSVFFHTEPAIPRRDISLDAVPSMPALSNRKLSRKDGAELLAVTRDTSAARYRELHGFTFGAPSTVREFDAGRGVKFYLSELLPANRLPLRRYHAASIWKNGVPIGYFEALTLFERMEAGFNLYYTFREGETAWLYRQLLRMFRQTLGIRAVTIDAYQIGHENDEAIQSGAFWFYRKLGFRSVDPALRDLTTREEDRIAVKPGYRSTARTLRRLVEHPMIYEFPDADAGVWDNFEARRVGLSSPSSQLVDALRDWPSANPARQRRLRDQVLSLGSAPASSPGQTR